MTVQPIYHEFASSLMIGTPDILILGDLCIDYSVNHEKTKIVNPGDFSTSKTFSFIYPHRKPENMVEQSSLE